MGPELLAVINEFPGPSERLPITSICAYIAMSSAADGGQRANRRGRMLEYVANGKARGPGDRWRPRIDEPGASGPSWSVTASRGLNYMALGWRRRFLEKKALAQLDTRELRELGLTPALAEFALRTPIWKRFDCFSRLRHGWAEMSVDAHRSPAGEEGSRADSDQAEPYPAAGK